MSEKKMRPIWFFVSLILMTMGGIIFLSGIYNLIDPPIIKTVLANTHPDIWWRGVMIVFGGLLYFKTRKQTV